MAEKEITWKFSKIGDKDLKEAIASMGEEAVKAQIKEEAARLRADVVWRRSAEKRLGLQKLSSAEIDKAIAKDEAHAKRYEIAWKNAASSVTKTLGSLGKTIQKDLKLGFLTSPIAFAQGKVTELFSGAIRDSMRLAMQAKMIAIQARLPGQKMADANALRKGFEATALANAGMKAEDVASGVGAFRQKSGSLEAAVKFQDMIAKVAQATGKDTEEIGAVAGRMWKQLKPKTVEELGDALAKVNYGARASGQSFDEAASGFMMATQRAKQAGFAGDAQGVRGLEAMMSAAGKGGSPEMAARTVAGFMQKLDQQAVKLKQAAGGKKGGLGLDIYRTDAEGQAQGLKRPIQDIIADMLGKARSKFRDKANENNASPMIAELKKMLGAGKTGGFAAIEPFVDAFNKTYAATAGTDKDKEAAATKAVLDTFNDLADAGGSYKDILQDSGAVQALAGSQMTAAYEQLKATVGEQLAPALQQFAKDLTTNTQGIQLMIQAVRALMAIINGIARVAEAAGIIKGGANTRIAVEADERAKAAKTKADTLAADYDFNDPKVQAAFVKARATQKAAEQTARDARLAAHREHEDTTLFDKGAAGVDIITGLPAQAAAPAAAPPPGVPRAGVPGAGGDGGASAHKDAAGHLTNAAKAIDAAAQKLGDKSRASGLDPRLTR